MGSVNQIYGESDKRRLHNDACLWRYVPLRTLIYHLTGGIFIPAVETLRNEDPFEGQFHFDIIWFNTVMHERYGLGATTYTAGSSASYARMPKRTTSS